jgi:antitoxin ParD1/3/4
LLILVILVTLSSGGKTMNVSLTPQLEQLVQNRVASGLYTSASEVIREALRLLERRDQLQNAQLERLRSEIAIGIEQADEGQLIPSQEVFAGLRRHYPTLIQDSE